LAITFMPVPSVVVRFPVELRAEPSMDLIHEIEPDAREVVLVAECFGLEPPRLDLCDRVDAETARFIAEQVLPLSCEEQRLRWWSCCIRSWLPRWRRAAGRMG